MASHIAQGFSTFDAYKEAKTYRYEAMLYSKEENIGKRQDYIHHFYQLWKYL
ncbi:MAG: hypothetical protein CMF42_01745 [Legionellales bacterium]|nr:hypothetical protein [Legionellales bacterium]